MPTEVAKLFVGLPTDAVFRRGACVSFLVQLAPARGRESGPEPRGEAVVFSCLCQRPTGREAVAVSCLFQLAPGRDPESSGRSQRPFRFSPTLTPFPLTLFLLKLILSPFHLMLSRVRPAALSVEQVVVQRPNLVFGRSKSSQKK